MPLPVRDAKGHRDADLSGHRLVLPALDLYPMSSCAPGVWLLSSVFFVTLVRDARACTASVLLLGCILPLPFLVLMVSLDEQELDAPALGNPA